MNLADCNHKAFSKNSKSTYLRKQLPIDISFIRISEEHGDIPSELVSKTRT